MTLMASSADLMTSSFWTHPPRAKRLPGAPEIAAVQPGDKPA
jgi:hypothetical protein